MTAKALVKYDPDLARDLGQLARMSDVYVNGHHFMREAMWRCPCGLRMPRSGLLGHQIPPCTRRAD